MSAPINSCLNVVVRSPTLFGLGQNGCWPSRGSQLPRTLPFIFSPCCPLNNRIRQHSASFKSVACFLFSCPSLARLHLLILLLLLMSGNIHPNPGPIYPCSVCAPNVAWRGKSVQFYTCSKWVHLKCSLLSLSKLRTRGSSHYWSCLPAVSLLIPLWLPPRTPPTRIPPLYNLAPFYANATLRPHPSSNLLFPVSPFCIFSLCPSPPSLVPGCSFTPPASAPLLTPSRFSNWMQAIFEPGALNCFTFFHPIPLTSVSRNPILTYLPLSGFLDSLLCVLITSTPGLAFSLLMPRTLAAAASSFLSGRAYLSLNSLPPLFAWSLL